VCRRAPRPAALQAASSVEHPDRPRRAPPERLLSGKPELAGTLGSSVPKLISFSSVAPTPQWGNLPASWYNYATPNHMHLVVRGALRTCCNLYRGSAYTGILGIHIGNPFGNLRRGSAMPMPCLSAWSAMSLQHAPCGAGHVHCSSAASLQYHSSLQSHTSLP
jgi:hypothetical protein